MQRITGKSTVNLTGDSQQSYWREAYRQLQMLLEKDDKETNTLHVDSYWFKINWFLMLFFGVSSVQFHLSVPRVVQKVAIYIYGWCVGNNTYPKWLQQLGVILIEVALKYYLFRYLVLKIMVKSPSISSCEDLCWLFVLFPISSVIKQIQREAFQ